MKQPFESRAIEAARTIVGRLRPGADLIRGLEEVCDYHGVRFAVITSAYGSLTRATFKVLKRPKGQDREVLVPQDIEERVEFLGGQGLICEDDEGQRATHLHGAVAIPSGTVQGGHFEPDRSPIYNNLDFVLVELHGVRLLRTYDPETDTTEMRVHDISR